MKFRSMSSAAPMALALSMTMALALAMPAKGVAAEALTAPVGDTQATATTDAPAVPAKEATVAKKAGTQCEFRTGTRIRAGKATGCESAVPWRSYTKQEIDATGYIDVAEALRHLDPIFQ